MRNLLAILLSTLTLLSTYGAANGIDGELLVKAGTTGNKALPTSQTTNVTISATSMVVDGVNVVAFSLNSSNVLSTSGAKLLALGNGGTNVTIVKSSGAVYIGEPSTADADLVIKRSDSGGASQAALDMTFDGSGVNDNSHIEAILSDGFGWFQLDFNGNDRVFLYSDPGETSISLRVGGNNKMYLFPNAAATNTPYTFDTSLTHTSGNLAEFNNNGTNYVTFQPDQASTNTPITININGTLKRVHVGAPDSGGTGLRALTVVN